MIIKKLIYLFKPPCPKCPYTLGRVVFFRDPCPLCKLNGYEKYQMLVQMLVEGK